MNGLRFTEWNIQIIISPTWKKFAIYENPCKKLLDKKSFLLQFYW